MTFNADGMDVQMMEPDSDMGETNGMYAGVTDNQTSSDNLDPSDSNNYFNMFDTVDNAPASTGLSDLLSGGFPALTAALDRGGAQLVNAKVAQTTAGMRPTSAQQWANMPPTQKVLLLAVVGAVIFVIIKHK